MFYLYDFCYWTITCTLNRENIYAGLLEFGIKVNPKPTEYNVP